MARDFVKLSEVTVLEEVSDTASVLVEQNGEIYRAPKTQVGGAGGIKTAIIRDSGYLNAIAQLSPMMQTGPSTPAYTYECINMTFEEAYKTMLNGEPLMVVGMVTVRGAVNVQGSVMFAGTEEFGTPCLIVDFKPTPTSNTLTLFWTADGLSTSQPSGGR